MNPKRTLPTLLGILLLSAGIFIALSLSLTMLWGEMEAELFMPNIGDKRLDLTCPLMIAPWETATIRTTVANTLNDLDKETKPQVNVSIRSETGVRTISETVILSSHERRTLQWEIDRSDIIFNRLLLINILQRPYRNLPSHQGTCSIVVFNLFGLNGSNALLVLVLTGILGSLLGALLLYSLYRPATEFAKSIFQVNGLFLFMALMSLGTALTRHWGWTLTIDAGAFIVFTSGNVEILMPHK